MKQEAQYRHSCLRPIAVAKASGYTIASMVRRRLRAARRNKERQRRNALAREAALELGEEEPRRLRYARNKTALEQLLARGSISPEQMRAGDRLGRDYRASCTNHGRLTGRYEPGPRPPKKYQQPADSLAAIAACMAWCADA
jgi:hypothetical protein